MNKGYSKTIIAVFDEADSDGDVFIESSIESRGLAFKKPSPEMKRQLEHLRILENQILEYLSPGTKPPVAKMETAEKGAERLLTASQAKAQSAESYMVVVSDLLSQVNEASRNGLRQLDPLFNLDKLTADKLRSLGYKLEEVSGACKISW